MFFSIDGMYSLEKADLSEISEIFDSNDETLKY